MASSADDPAQQLLGHLAAVPAGRSLNVPQTRGKYQVSSSGCEALGQVLRPEDPGVVGQPAGGIRPAVAVDQLPGRGHADGVGVERELLRVLDEVEQVGVASG